MHEYVDPIKFKTMRRYTYKDKSCVRKELDSKLAQQISGYTLIEKDLRSCLVWLSEIDRLRVLSGGNDLKVTIRANNREIYNIVKALYVALITFYAKCFTSGEGRRAKLERVHLEEKYRSLHDERMLHRNNFTAHSGGQKVETCTLALVSPAKVARDKNIPFEIFRETLNLTSRIC